MVRKNAKILATTFFMGIVLGFGTIAYAGTAVGSWKYFGPVFGYSYKNQAYVETRTNAAEAGTTIASDGSGSIPTGYMGAQARLYYNGDLYASSSTSYTSSSNTQFEVSIVKGNPPTGTYHSTGVTQVYNGNGYDTYYTNQSPSQSY